MGKKIGIIGDLVERTEFSSVRFLCSRYEYDAAPEMFYTKNYSMFKQSTKKINKNRL